MRKLFLFLILYIYVPFSFSQYIKQIAAYDNQNSYTSGLFALYDTAVYRYSWYYQEWFPLSNQGLTHVQDTVKISSLAVYNNKWDNSSGIFVFSDTVVLNYNWISASWFPLSNNGLPRIAGKPDVKMLAVYGDSGSSSNSTIFALTDTAVYYYIWYYQEWYPLLNDGLQNAAKDAPSIGLFNISASPNPFDQNLTIKLQFYTTFHGKLTIAVFDINGTLVGHKIWTDFEGNEIDMSPLLCNKPAGCYLCEIKAGEHFKTIKVVKKGIAKSIDR